MQYKLVEVILMKKLLSAAAVLALAVPVYLGATGVGAAPAGADQCKKGGYEALGFRNQGQCVSFFARQQATVTTSPTSSPTVVPTVSPTVEPTVIPTIAPTATPIATATVVPTVAPTASAIPTIEPTETPILVPVE